MRSGMDAFPVFRADACQTAIQQRSGKDTPGTQDTSLACAAGRVERGEQFIVLVCCPSKACHRRLNCYRFPAVDGSLPYRNYYPFLTLQAITSSQRLQFDAWLA